jgi:5-methyltetrahydropteroyltriglutamate--homocysteine methyltransferase
MRSIKTASLGFSRIGAKRELKIAVENYWKNADKLANLQEVARQIRAYNWFLQKDFDYIPSGDFSYYDHVLDLSFEFNNIPVKFAQIAEENERYFAVARGYQKNGLDFAACELSKWFNTNYHYIVPEFQQDIEIKYTPRKFVSQFLEAKSLGYHTRPVIIGPVSYLLLGKAKTASLEQVLPSLLEAYSALFADLQANGCTDIQIDEPFLCTDLSDEQKSLYDAIYSQINLNGLNLHLVSYFDEIAQNIDIAVKLPVKSIHIDAVNEPNLATVCKKIPQSIEISLGLVNGRNIWKNDIVQSVELAKKAGREQLIIAGSCSFLHVPVSLEFETKLSPEIKNRLAFAKEKLIEIKLIRDIVENKARISVENQHAIRKNEAVWERLKNLEANTARKEDFATRKEAQKYLNLPLFPTTTIGSFPQTQEVRKNRADFKNGTINQAIYEAFCKSEIAKTIKIQEDIGLDVLVHGECERNDMVEYFGENLDGFAFTQNGWVQSYGSRCVKPPVIYGDVSRPKQITVEWARYAQSLSKKPVKGMLTGPVTIQKWSFVREDIPLETSCKQIALALLDEVLDLQNAGINIIQIDEPALREGLPLRKTKWNETLKWSVDAFKISCQTVAPTTQIHTHMCYSEFNDIISHILALDADCLSIECSRSDLEVLQALKDNGYANDIGPGVWDIHSPRVPSVEEISGIVRKILEILKPEQVWLNPDCGLKTRGWDETITSLKNLVTATKSFR